MELQPSTQSSSQEKNFVNTSKRLLEKNLNFFRSALFHMKTGVSLKYFARDVSENIFFSKSHQALSNLIYLTILVTPRPLTQF